MGYLQGRPVVVVLVRSDAMLCWLRVGTERNQFGLRIPRICMDHDHCSAIMCECGFRGAAIPMRQHMECPRCRRVVEACCEGVPDYSQ